MIKAGNIERKRLTQSQLAIWTGQKMAPDTPLYNMVYTFDIDHQINVKAFRSAFHCLVGSTENLRTIFGEEDAIPFQTVLSKIDYDFNILDFDKDASDDELQKWAANRGRRNLNLGQCPFDSVLLKMTENRFIWFLNIHHIVTDAISFTILCKKLFEFYINLINSNQKNIENTPSYDEYLKYEGEQQESERNHSTQKYWKEKVDRLLTLPQLYGADNKPLKTASERITLNLGLERSKKLKELSQNPKVKSLTPRLTLFNLIATILFAYLYRVGNQKKIAIGAPAHNRPSTIFQKIPGLFIEIFPLILELDDDDTFQSVIKRTQLETNDYLRHGKSGMSTADISRSFNVILNYITSKFDDIDDIPIKSNWVHVGHHDPAHHMRCHVYDFDAKGNLEIHFDLNTDVFDEKLRESAPKHFLNLMDALIEDIDKPIGQTSIVTEKESKELLVRSSKIVSYGEETIISQFEFQVSQNPNALALYHRDEKVSYQELDNKVNRLSNYLENQGFSQDDTISINLERSSDYIVSILAVLKLGAAFVPISSDQPITRLEYILEDSKSKALITNNLQAKEIDFENIFIVNLDELRQDIENEVAVFRCEDANRDAIAYIIYTSGSTGKPKGVLISNASLANYIDWAKNHYSIDETFTFPLCTSIGFDLTITSTFLPLVTGGELIVYTESTSGPDISIMQVIEDNLVNSVKLTPSHLNLLKDVDLSNSKLRLIIVGGENFKSSLAKSIQDAIGDHLNIFNEYGPTEATVGCIVSKFDEHSHLLTSVPIGKPIANMSSYVLDNHRNLVPNGVIGELYLGGIGLAKGYSQNETLTSKRFLENPFRPNTKMYRTGDFVRRNKKEELEYLGRADEQVKLNGFRIELSDVESNLNRHPRVDDAAVVLIDSEQKTKDIEVVNCKECGLPSNYPNIDFDDNDVCHLCSSFKGYKEKTDKYFKSEQDLKELLTSKKDSKRKYDCLSLLSGGKDSTYVLARLIDMGLKVLAFTLDNGYISDQAKANISKITTRLGVDHIYGETPHMNKIFVDSLHRHKNVCNGCFKTIYTLSTKVALENDIPFIVTGLSRGQFFETRLTEELFWNEDADGKTIDDTILEARKLYHQEEDAVKKHLDTSMFNTDSTFDKVQYVDFYRYSAVSLSEMLKFLKEKAGWIRPTDTGRSTNCLINQAGIHVHKKEKGYSNYSFPYSWDVRLGHKNREEALDEIDEEIDVAEVNRILDEIGYKKPERDGKNRKQLVGFYTATNKIPSVDLSLYLAKQLPEYMLPTSFKYLDKMPLTDNGKVNKNALRSLNDIQLDLDTPYLAPTNEIEELIERIWKEVLLIDKIGMRDNFIALGGHSLAAIRVTARINDELQTKFALNKIFEFPTIEEYATFIEKQLVELMQQ